MIWAFPACLAGLCVLLSPACLVAYYVCSSFCFFFFFLSILLIFLYQFLFFLFFIFSLFFFGARQGLYPLEQVGV